MLSQRRAVADEDIARDCESMTLESRSDLVIGIDFGTTFTGVAYAHSAQAVSGDASKTAENVHVVKSWPSANSSYMDKIPSIIAYNTNPPTWGGNVKARDVPQVAHFKLGLQPSAKDHYLRGSSHDKASALAFLESDWNHPQLPGKKALDFAADYLTCIHTYVREVLFPRQFGAAFLQNQQLSYVITVPAIWKDSAKALTREAATRAGIPNHKLELITEPEAAALYCATICNEVDLIVGDRFLVCDAGGGTVDLISYEVVSLAPFCVEECNLGSGAACGAVFLNKGFEELLRQKFGGRAESILTPKRLTEAVRFFENSIKVAFNPYDEWSENEFDVPLGALDDIPEIGLEDGDDVENVFIPIFDQIYDLINQQIYDVETKYRRKMKTLFLVGGLGSSLYLVRFLQKKLKSRIDVKQPLSGYGAIMRGAVLHKLGLNLVKERIMRRSYGICRQRPFQRGTDPERLKYVDSAGEVVCKEVMYWYAKKGQKMPNEKAVDQLFYRRYSPAQYQTIRYSIFTLSVSEADIAPTYSDDSVSELCKVNVDLDPLKPFVRKFGAEGPYYEMMFRLEVIFGPELIFKIVQNGKMVGSVVTKYS